MGFKGKCGLVALGILLIPVSAFAIPSPDVIVNVFASAGQVLGLLSVVFGASFFGKKKNPVEESWFVKSSVTKSFRA